VPDDDIPRLLVNNDLRETQEVPLKGILGVVWTVTDVQADIVTFV